MTATAEQLRAHLLALPESDRAELAHILLDSLEPAQSDDEDHELLEELERREADMRSGKSIPIPAEEVFARIDARLAAMQQ